MRRVRVADCGIGLAFRPVGMDVYSLDNAGAAAVSPGRVKSLKNLNAGRLNRARQMLRGESPPGR
jgi:hypothetical protein